MTNTHDAPRNFFDDAVSELLELLSSDEMDTDEWRAFVDRDMRAMERRTIQRALKPFRHHRRKSHGLTKGFHRKKALLDADYKERFLPHDIELP